ncbi:MAG: hypothetical protein C0503_09250 [Gemmatimonas sp.]|nr:hypothetical protein [Gemmatimonas sp.]
MNPVIAASWRSGCVRSLVAEEAPHVVVVADKYDFKSIDPQQVNDAQIESGATLEVAALQAADGKAGVLVRRAPDFLQAVERLFDPRMVLVAESPERLEEALRES